MVKPSIVTPLFCTTLGTALSYYGFDLLREACVAWPLVILTVLIVLFAAISFFRVCAVAAYFLKKTHVCLITFSIGLTLGLAVGGQRAVTYGLAQDIQGISGTLMNDPRGLRGGNGMATLELTQATGHGGLRASAHGSILVFFPAVSLSALKEFGRGAQIYTEGKFVTNPGRDTVFQAVSVHIVKPSPRLEQIRTIARMALIEKYSEGTERERFFPGIAGAGNWRGLALALIVGTREELIPELNTAFVNAGCAHVLALSGMHLAIIAALLAFVLRRPLGLKLSLAVGAAFIVVYVFIVGAQASLVRSCIMYLLGVYAVWGHLRKDIAALLCLSFLIQILLPAQAQSGYSISFILSYLALAGIVYISGFFHSIFRGLLPEYINQGLSASAGAVIATAAVCVYFFGFLRPVGLAASLVLVPLVTVFMIAAILYLLCAVCLPPLAALIDLFLSTVYRVLESIAALAGTVPGIESAQPLVVLAVSLVLIVCVSIISTLVAKRRLSVAAFA
ncbi:competence protein ComEC [Spirochaetia bacterium]|nr:competence protein ComEC [Spirochaetia bacterium]